MSFDLLEISRRIRALGNELTPAAIEGTAALYAPFQESEPYQGVRVTRDSTYGTHERHRLDIFEAQQRAAQPRPVLLFVHGGGFVRGDKRMPGSPYNDNVALWAVRNGLVGVNMTYRLAPEFMWPSGPEDVAAAVTWVRDNIAQHGGDPQRIFLLGTSAGAVHVASYIVNREFHPAKGVGVAGGILMSGMYEMKASDKNPMHTAYLGEDEAVYAKASTLQGLVETPVPLLFILTEMDPPDFQRQGAALVSRYLARHGRWPNLLRLQGHNHLSSTMHMNSPDVWPGQQMLDFISG